MSTLGKSSPDTSGSLGSPFLALASCMFLPGSAAPIMSLQVDDVDDVLANINEQNDAMEQINAAMGQPIGPSADIDEDDLEKEFEVRAHCPLCCSAHR
jgi:Snf7